MSDPPNRSDCPPETDDAVRALFSSLRDEPTPDRRLRVEARVREAWYGTLGQRRRRRQRIVLALAASTTIAMLALWWRLGTVPTNTASPSTTARAVFATVASVEGLVLRRPSATEVRELALAAGDTVRVSDHLETGDGRLGLIMVSGASLRFDSATVARLDGLNRLDLEAGALYFDNHAATMVGPIRVATRFGTAHDIGTRFAVRIAESTLVVTVRDGEVAIEPTSGPSVRATGGQAIVLSADGEVGRQSITTFDTSWAWTASVAPGFDLDGATLASFIRWLEHESGWTVRFREASLESQAATWTLAGPSLAGMAFDDALAMALRINDLTFEREDGMVTIEGGS